MGGTVPLPALQDSLTFPKEAEVSETAVRMLQGLLTSADRRFSYQDVCGHTFFASVDWNNIRQSEPPDVSFVSEGDSEAKHRPRIPGWCDRISVEAPAVRRRLTAEKAPRNQDFSGVSKDLG